MQALTYSPTVHSSTLECVNSCQRNCCMGTAFANIEASSCQSRIPFWKCLQGDVDTPCTSFKDPELASWQGLHVEGGPQMPPPTPFLPPEACLTLQSNYNEVFMQDQCQARLIVLKRHTTTPLIPAKERLRSERRQGSQVRKNTVDLPEAPLTTPRFCHNKSLLCQECTASYLSRLDS
eukprot:1160762-Pelagomonas_calceolata.AAC.4